MNNLDLFTLYGLVQQKDKLAELELIARHRLKYPLHAFHKQGISPGYSSRYRQDLHTIYLHLTK